MVETGLFFIFFRKSELLTMKNRKLNIPFGLNGIYTVWRVHFKRREFLILKTIIFISKIYISSVFLYLIIREVIKHDVYGKQQTANGKNETFAFCLQLSLQ